jgi:CheY-like chemotaxis protein
MVVDDDDELREAIAKLVAAIAGVEVVSFPSGAAALNAFAAAPDTFEFIVSDLDMPGMSGIEFCRRIHSDRPSLSILLATGSGVITIEEARAYGFCGLIAKPFSVAALRQALAVAAPKDQQTKQAGFAPVCLAA